MIHPPYPLGIPLHVQCLPQICGGVANDSVSTSYLPVIDSLLLTPSIPSADDTLLCEATAYDTDGDIPVLEFSWSNRSTGAVYSSTTTTTDSTLDLNTVSARPTMTSMLGHRNHIEGGSTTDSIPLSSKTQSHIFPPTQPLLPAAGCYQYCSHL